MKELFEFQTPILIMDLETTGLSKTENLIIQIGMVVQHPDGKQSDLLELDIRSDEVGWEGKIVTAALQKNGINLKSHNMIALNNIDARKKLENYLQSLKVKYDKNLFIGGHNIIGFDLPFIEDWFNRKRKSKPRMGDTWFEVYFGWLKVFDSLEMFRSTFPVKSFPFLESHKKDDIIRWMGMDTTKHGQLHHALPDAKYEGEMIFSMYKSGLLGLMNSLVKLKSESTVSVQDKRIADQVRILKDLLA